MNKKMKLRSWVVGKGKKRFLFIRIKETYSRAKKELGTQGFIDLNSNTGPAKRHPRVIS
jgi:hypothetical protein